jgi:hypothetical protein
MTRRPSGRSSDTRDGNPRPCIDPSCSGYPRHTGDCEDVLSDTRDEEDLDEIVHDLKGAEAAEINNGGREAQIRFIDGVCVIEGCEGSWRTRGLCHGHYQNWRSWARKGTAASDEQLMAAGLLLPKGQGGCGKITRVDWSSWGALQAELGETVREIQERTCDKGLVDGCPIGPGSVNQTNTMRDAVARDDYERLHGSSRERAQ